MHREESHPPRWLRVIYLLRPSVGLARLVLIPLELWLTLLRFARFALLIGALLAQLLSRVPLLLTWVLLALTFTLFSHR